MKVCEMRRVVISFTGERRAQKNEGCKGTSSEVMKRIGELISIAPWTTLISDGKKDRVFQTSSVETILKRMTEQQDCSEKQALNHWDRH